MSDLATKPDLEPLIARLAAAAEGSRELDYAIAGVAFGSQVPSYTTSIDAALTLLEPEWDYEIQRLQQTTGIYHVRVWQGAVGDLVEYDGINAHAPTAALAVCISALCARSAP